MKRFGDSVEDAVWLDSAEDRSAGSLRAEGNL
jgi:hypothetical protein